MFFKQGKNFLSRKSKKFINEIVLAQGSFPFYIHHMHHMHPSKKQVRVFMGHVIKERSNNIKEIWNSPYYREFIDIINEFCEQKKIKIKGFYRICVNLSFNNGYERSEIHEDHDFPHYQIIIFLNKPEDKDAETVILDKKNKIIKKITPVQYQGICFDKHLHYIKVPKFGHRVALVATFK
tara:strand:+ start:174 stop:713 length:540 start_codon:yes stop_codon:yes gene_type:complete